LWGNGSGRQMTVALLEMSFNQLIVDRCEASSVEYNDRAHRALEAVGFRRTGVLRQSAFVNGRKWNLFHFDILRDKCMSVRSDLLKQTLTDKLEEYQERHCNMRGSKKNNGIR
jgi:RimJ/RimL family protein N-acetyltransferase